MTTDNLIGTHTLEMLASPNDDAGTGWETEIAADWATRRPYNAVEAMQRSIAEDYEAMREEQAAGFPADCGTANNGHWYVDTRITRNERYSNNGGEYSFWTEYWHANGRTYRLEKCSCDFWQPMQEPDVCDGEIDFTVQ